MSRLGSTILKAPFISIIKREAFYLEGRASFTLYVMCTGCCVGIHVTRGYA